MKIYKISTLGTDIVICEGRERNDAVTVLADVREDVEYSVSFCPKLFFPDVLRALSGYLYFVKGLPSSTYTLEVNGALTPIPVPRKARCRFGGCIGSVSLSHEGRTPDGLPFYDLLTPVGICRAAVCESVPPTDFTSFGKSLIRLGGRGGVIAAFCLAKLSEGYGVLPSSVSESCPYTAVTGAAAYLVFHLFGDEACRIVIDKKEADCTVTPGGVSVFDSNLRVFQAFKTAKES